VILSILEMETFFRECFCALNTGTFLGPSDLDCIQASSMRFVGNIRR